MIATLSLVASLALAQFQPSPPPTLSEAAEASKAAFTRLMNLKDGVSTARVEALRLPGTIEYLASPEGMMGFVSLSQSLENHPEGAPQAIAILAAELPKIDHLQSWDGYSSIYLTREARKAGDPALAERVRTEYIDLIDRTLAKKDFPDKGLADMTPHFFELSREHLVGSAIQGKLLDRPAPELKFLWSSDPALHSLADLKGKVVVLDFWATWCKPCIGLFPTIRKIAESYKGMPVAFVGVTSVQGFSMDPKLGRINTKNDTKKEFGVMPGLMRQLGVTWTVAFSDQDCFNPDFDIMEIPHMAIVDQSGLVRFDGVEPTELKSKVDSLLQRK